LGEDGRLPEHPRTAEWSYSFRPSGIALETHYRLDGEHIDWSNRRSRGRIAYDEIEKMRVFKERFLGSSATYVLERHPPSALRSQGETRSGAPGRIWPN
jgi:hypothetical protein